MSDTKSLFLRHRSGDPTALPQLVERLSPRLRLLARRMNLTAHSADDAVQEAWLAAIRSAHNYDPEQPFLPWLHGLLRHTVQNQRRRDQRQVRALAMLASGGERKNDEGEAGEVAAARREAADHLRAAIRTLPRSLRDPLTLHLLDGLPPKDIANRLGLPQGTVRVLLFRGRLALRRRLPPALVLGAWTRPDLQPPRPCARAGMRFAAAALVLGAMMPFFQWSFLGHPSADATVANTPMLVVESFSPTTDASPAFTTSSTTHRESASLAARLSVRVSDANGQPVPAVAVTIEPRDGTDPRLHRDTAVTNDDGTAWFPPAPAAGLRIFTDRGLDTVLAAGAATTLDLQLPGTRILEGKLTDDLGSPLANAGVWLGRADDDGYGAVVVRTAADGSFVLRAVPADATVAAFAEGHRRTPRVRTSGRTCLTLQATRGGGEVVVRVRDGAGNPLPDARVFAGHCADGVPARLPNEVAALLPPASRATTGANGEAVIAHLEPGTHPIVVRAPGHAPHTVEAIVDDGGRTILECRLENADCLCGRIVDTCGNPVVDAQVLLHSEDRSGDVTLRTASDGTFLAAAVPATIDELRITSSGHFHAHHRPDPAEGSAPFEIELAPLPEWRGRIVDDTGAPLAGHEIRFDSSESRPARPDCVVTSCADGTFATVAPGAATCRVSVRAPHWPLSLDLPRTCVARLGTDVLITVPRDRLPSGRLHGHLAHADGTPVANRRIALVMFGPHGETTVRPDIGRTDAAGRLDIGPLPAGRCRLVLTATDSNSVAGVVGDYVVAAATSRDVTTVLPAPVSTTGRYHFPDGSHPRTLLAVVQVPGTDLTVTTQPDGLAQQLLPGDYHLHVVGEGFAWLQDVPLPARASTLCADATLELARTIRVQPAEWPADLDAGAGIWIRTNDGGTVGRRLCHFPLEGNDDRPFRMAIDLADGDYVVEARCASGRIARAPFRVSEVLADANLRLQFEP